MKIKSFIMGLGVGIVIAIVLIVFLYVNYTSKIQLLEQEKNSIGSRLATCQNSLSQCQEQTSILARMVEQLQSNLQQLQQEKKGLETSLEACVSEKESLARDFEATRSSLQVCKVDKEKLESKIVELKEQVKSLEDEKTRLESQVNKLKDENKMLTQQLEDSNKQIEYLCRQVAQLTSTIEELNRELEESRYRYKQLEDSYNELTDTVRDTNIWFLVYDNILELYEFYDELLEASVEAVKEVVDIGEFRGGAGERAFKVFEYVLKELSYYPDNYVRYVDPSNNVIEVRDEVTMLPNETWMNGGGDCEDLALFTYALLKATNSSGEKVYLIFWYGWFLPWEKIGHAAVLLVHEDDEGKKYYIIDPAGNYFNGIGACLEMTVVDRDDIRRKTCISPLHVSGNGKSRLIEESFATMVYIFHATGETVDDPTTYYYRDAYKALKDWIEYWSESLLLVEPQEIEIHGVGVHETFTSIKDAANWLSHS